MAKRDAGGGACPSTITAVLFVAVYLGLIACSGVAWSPDDRARGWTANERELLAQFRARHGRNRLEEARAVTPMLVNYLDVATLNVAVGWSDAPTRDELLAQTGPADNTFSLASHPGYLGPGAPRDLSQFQVLMFDLGCDDNRQPAAARPSATHEPFCRTLDVVLFSGRVVHASITHDAPANTARWLAAR